MRRLLTVLLALAVAACGDGRSSAERAAEQGIVIVGNNQEPQSLDPHMATAVADGKIICAMLEGLMPAEHPGMAETWEHNEDASVWTFHLRDAQWSDGQPVTAQDFAYAYRRLLHPDFGGKYAEMLYPIRNAEAYNRGQCKWEDVGVETPDARTLRLTLEGPTPHLPKLMQHYTWFPVPAHAV